MTFGVLSFFGCGLLGAGLALYYAGRAQRDIELSGGRVRGMEHVRLARGLVWAHVFLAALVLLIYVALTLSG